MKLIINNTDISYTEQSMKLCNYSDYAGGHADRLSIVMNDTYDEWKEWGLKKGDIIQAKTDSIDTGKMYVSELGIKDGRYMIRALSTPVNALNESTYIKENITFDELLKATAESELGFDLMKYNTENWLYPYVERINKNPIEFLNTLAIYEGYLIKICDNRLIIYKEKIMENAESKVTISEDDFTKQPEFSSSDSKLISEINNSYIFNGNLITSKVSSNISGKKLYLQLPVTSLNESTRFTQNIMRHRNKFEFCGHGIVDNILLAAGQTVLIDGNFGDWSGHNFIYQVTHDLIFGKKEIFFRKPVGGMY